MAGEVEVVGRDGLVVLVRDEDRDRLVGARLWLLTLDLQFMGAATPITQKSSISG
jgi:hypothetical protein